MSRTPPDIKWLLNERAALAGEVEKALAKQAVLAHKRDRLRNQLAVVLKAMERSQVAQARSQASLDALDATMGIVNKGVNPGAGGSVWAWAGKYGSRGGLGEYIARVLEGAAPEPVTTSVLIDLASRQFGLVLSTPAERRSFRKSVSSALTSFQKRNLIEAVHDRKAGSHGLWCWREEFPTFAEMAAQSGIGLVTVRAEVS
ncbi:hypothetical protein C5F53_06895 [Rhodoferax sp. TS-BS-61-7]|nr:hypothetical protein C5F53_06895 [Rhodoferax sp. TS-BS-61-7]